MSWSQNYAPLGNGLLSAMVAALPVVTLLGLLAFWHVRAHLAALAGLIVAAAVAVFVYHMPAGLVLAAGGYGAAFGLFPIGWIILNAIFIYHISVETGQFAALQRQVAGLSSDRRIQALLVAFSFGAFIEGAAGFGTPVAISGAIMIGLGFRPLEAAKLALIGNTAPVAFGSLGTPLITLAKIADLDLHLLSMMVGRQLTFFAIIVPFWLTAAQSGWRGMKAVWPACLVTGLTFGLAQLAMSNLHGPWLVNIVSAIASMAALIVLMRFWKPAQEAAVGAPVVEVPKEAVDTQPAWKAWLPWVFLSILVFLWGLPAMKASLNTLFAPAFEVPLLHKAVVKVPPVVVKNVAEEAVFTFNAISATGTALLLAGILSGLALGLSPLRLFAIYARTFMRVRISLLTIGLMLALGFVTRYSGSDTTIGLAMAGTGWLFPFFSPIIGWLGVALTGSDTASNVLFGNLQKVSAQQLGLSPILMAASNSTGGVMGKMIDAQSIVVASVATGGHPESPDAGAVLRSVFWHSLALAILVGVMVMLQAYVFTWMVPK
ncbi:MAG: L-lactate transport [Verrucomicrobiaceae bacterium]|nr:L-lactate transport [Verrucomicrobiaceae bacterium]